MSEINPPQQQHRRRPTNGAKAERLRRRYAARDKARPRSAAHLAGFFVPLTLICVLTAPLAGFVPSFDQFLGTNLRMFDSLAPQLLLVSIPLILLLVLIGYRRIALLCLAIGVAGGAFLVWDYQRHTAPAGTETDLTVLWFNILAENKTPPSVITAALRGSGADVIFLTEARQMIEEKVELADLYPHQKGCDDEKTCNMIVLSKLPFDKTRVFDLESGADRMMRVNLSFPEHGRLTLIGLHMLKPWYLGLTGGDDEFIKWYLWSVKTPLVLMGDFNAAPWSYRMRRLQKEQNVKFPKLPIPTWPVAAGSFGVPIDHMLVRRGARLVSLTPWGDDLGSNHRALLAEIDLP